MKKVYFCSHHFLRLTAATLKREWNKQNLISTHLYYLLCLAFVKGTFIPNNIVSRIGRHIWLLFIALHSDTHHTEIMPLSANSKGSTKYYNTKIKIYCNVYSLFIWELHFEISDRYWNGGKYYKILTQLKFGLRMGYFLFQILWTLVNRFHHNCIIQTGRETDKVT